jgi:molecular chaperone DnaK
MAVHCGIDLGTTYSSISWFDSYNNRVDVVDLETADGQKIVRSVVYYPEGGQPPVVGNTAWNASKQFPDRVITGVKRSMGTDYKAVVDGEEYTPQQVSAEILKAVIRDAQVYLAEEVKDVIITVPAYFGDNERAATEEAGKLAGLNVLGLLPSKKLLTLWIGIFWYMIWAGEHLT